MNITQKKTIATTIELNDEELEQLFQVLFEYRIKAVCTDNPHSGFYFAGVLLDKLKSAIKSHSN